ncbi:dihydrofolate reductase family protein [Microbacteriaceae bacterium VKM Ac-2855]|nr:dihydrofolate reductase family protein [Microbacteriaceae bacterium VKM Ac-2855]
MRELTYFVAVSLDGRIAAPDGDFSAFPVTGDHIEWIFREYRDTLPAAGLEMLGLTADNSRFDAVVMGWNTYAAGLAQGVTDPYPHLEQFVFTRKSRTVPEHIHLRSDALETVRRLKEGSGAGVWLCGGGSLAAELVDEIDRLVLKVNPLVMGDGIPLFGGLGAVHGFELIASTPYRSGVVVNEYARP